MAEVKDTYDDGEASVEKPEKMLTVEEIRWAMENPGIKLAGRISVEVLEAFLVVDSYCAFSEVMAEGTDSWINQGSARLDGYFLQLDLSGVAGLEDAKRSLRASLNCPPYTKLTRLIQAQEAGRSDGGVHVALEDRYVSIDI